MIIKDRPSDEEHYEEITRILRIAVARASLEEEGVERAEELARETMESHPSSTFLVTSETLQEAIKQTWERWDGYCIT